MTAKTNIAIPDSIHFLVSFRFESFGLSTDDACRIFSRGELREEGSCLCQRCGAAQNEKHRDHYCFAVHDDFLLKSFASVAIAIRFFCNSDQARRSHGFGAAVGIYVLADLVSMPSKSIKTLS